MGEVMLAGVIMGFMRARWWLPLIAIWLIATLKGPDLCRFRTEPGCTNAIFYQNVLIMTFAAYLAFCGAVLVRSVLEPRQRPPER